VGSIFQATPKCTLAVLPDQKDHLLWAMGSRANSPMMVVVGDFHLRNIHTGATSVPKVFLVVRRPRHLWLRRLRFEGSLDMRNQHANLDGRLFEIPPGRTTTGRVMWFIQPPIKPPGKPLRARAIFVDRFGNEHRTALLTFRAR